MSCPHEDVLVIANLDQKTMTLDDVHVRCRTCAAVATSVDYQVVLGPWEDDDVWWEQV